MSAMGSGLGWRLRAISNSDPAPKGKVEDIMSAPVKAARPETHLAQIVPFMADAGLHHLPVVDGRLVGMCDGSHVRGGDGRRKRKGASGAFADQVRSCGRPLN